MPDQPAPPEGPPQPEQAVDRAHLHPETRAIRAGRDDNDTALAPILWATTTFVTPTPTRGALLVLKRLVKSCR